MQPKIQKHVVKCSQTIQLRRKFIKAMLVDLMNKKPDELNKICILDMIKDIAVYLKGNDEEG